MKRKEFTVGMPKAFSVYTLWPFYSWFFHELGIEFRLSEKICHEGIARTEGSYCFPAEIAHGAVQDIVNRKFDYIFVPHFRDMESYEDDGARQLLPHHPGAPLLHQQGLSGDKGRKVFSLPIVSFKYGTGKGPGGLYRDGEQLGIPEREI